MESKLPLGVGCRTGIAFVLGFCVGFVDARSFKSWDFLLLGRGPPNWTVAPCRSLNRNRKPSVKAARILIDS